jgi:hypothetical protein
LKLAACPPVAEYSREFHARAAEEMAMLPNGSALVEMMVDYLAHLSSIKAITGQTPSGPK